MITTLNVVVSARMITFILIFVVTLFSARTARADLYEIRQRGVLRHLGIPYANFISGAGDGLDIELMRRFAQEIGVKYQFVKTDWPQIFGDLTGKKVTVNGDNVEQVGSVSVKGDVAANGITVLPWREKIVNFSDPVFPNQIWLVARSDSPVRPIKPSKNLQRDIKKVKSFIRGRSLLGKTGTCLDPLLYGLQDVPAKTVIFPGSLNDLAPAIISGQADMALLDVPDALVALQKWPGEIKVIGPVSANQVMAAAFAKDSPRLREEFNRFLKKSLRNGFLLSLVKKYYPYVLHYYPDFFSAKPN
ncbi:MAG: transporter substrate-binding domain-containing protein [Desulfobulbus sp.]|nr:transporter substrate-binding domain-containing protein [Desulfobulbus sp.]